MRAKTPSLTRSVLKRRVLLNILFFVLVLAGLFAGRGIAVDAYPNVDLDAAAIQTVWSGASPEEVERLVTARIEEEIQGIQGVDRIVSDSRPNRSSVLVKFVETLSDADVDRAFSDIRAALERIEDLPADALKPVLQRQTVFEIFPLVSIGVGFDRPEREATAREVARELREALLALDGIAKVDDRNLPEPELTVLVDRARAEALDVTLEEIVGKLRATNRNVPAGAIREEGGGEVAVKAAGNYRAARDLEATVVRHDPEGAHVRVADVARVVEATKERDVKSRFRGRDAIILPVVKDEGRNSLDLVDAVKAVLAEFRARGLPEGIDIGIAVDSSQIIRDRLGVLLANLGQGVVLVFLILWASIGLKNSALAMVGIPFSFLVALLCMSALGVTINAISLFALVLVSGVVVDDALVILENIHRYREQGLSRREAVIVGTEEVLGPVVNSSLTTIAAFLPMLLTVGVVGEFFSIIPKVVTAVLIASLFEAFVILPVHVFDLWGRERPPPPSPARPGWSVRTGVALRAAYGRALVFCLGHRRAVLAVVLAVSLLALSVWKRLDTLLFPSDFQVFLVNLEMPADASLEETAEASRGVDAVLERVNREGPFRGQIDAWTTSIGVAFSSDNVLVVAPHIAQAFVSLSQGTGVDPLAIKDYTARLMERIRRAPATEEERGIAALLARCRKLNADPQQDGPPTGKPVAVRVRCDDLDEAERVAADLRAALLAMPGVHDVEDNHDEGRVEMRVVLEEGMAAAHGISFERAALALAAANDGVVVSVFKDPGAVEDADVRVRFRPEDRGSVTDVARVRLRGESGATIPLGAIARIEAERSHAGIYRYDGRRTILVTADIDTRATTAVEVNEALRARFDRPDYLRARPGVHLRFGGEFEETRKSFRSLGEAFLVAVLAIYMLLAAQLGSYLQPLIVMFTVPLAFIGVVFGLAITGNPFTIMAGIAMIGLTGMVVNGAIVLLSFVRARREAGMAPEEALLEACHLRARPILLTALTTVAGLFPMAIGLSGYSKLWSPFAATLSFGLGFSTLLTLFIIPILCKASPKRA